MHNEKYTLQLVLALQRKNEAMAWKTGIEAWLYIDL